MSEPDVEYCESDDIPFVIRRPSICLYRLYRDGSEGLVDSKRWDRACRHGLRPISKEEAMALAADLPMPSEPSCGCPGKR